MKIWKQILSILVSACLVVGMLPMASLAAESNGETINTSGLCEHHTAHDETCGYVKGIAESPCTHEHGEGCYTWIKSCTHTHTEDCYPVLDSSIPDGMLRAQHPPAPSRLRIQRPLKLWSLPSAVIRAAREAAVWYRN